jgi:uncharacterized sporulation protein YeaH/YhbH (DUF444 family)
MGSIDNDYHRFKKIVDGKLRENLKRFVQKGERIVKKGRDSFVVPMPNIDIPRFKFGSGDGVGQGNGKEGDKIGQGQPGEGQPGQGEVGDGEGAKELEAEFSAKELASILGDELELPKIEPKGENQIAKKIFRYNTLGINGPQSLKHMKKTFFNSIKRQMALGQYDPKNPTFLPNKADFRYRSYTVDYEYDASATVFYIMDVSGSMGDEQKERVRTLSFWMNIWLKSNYKNINMRYIIHDSTAKEVDEKRFFSTRESGGTLISSSYELVKDIIEQEKIMDNIYIFQCSDGDNWTPDDNHKCVDMLKNYFLKTVNMFGYAQVTSRYGSGEYFKILDQTLGKEEDLILAKIDNNEDILDSIKTFLGKGK